MELERFSKRAPLMNRAVLTVDYHHAPVPQETFYVSGNIGNTLEEVRYYCHKRGLMKQTDLYTNYAVEGYYSAHFPKKIVVEFLPHELEELTRDNYDWLPEGAHGVIFRYKEREFDIFQEGTERMSAAVTGKRKR